MKILFYIAAFLAFFIADLSNVYAHHGEEGQYFIVTAYYSPLPDQKFYATGNYEAEMILNGRGIAGASGKKVFSGMLAAPKKYKFGTKIRLEGLGVGSVEDRGGAIVPAGERGFKHDRIDVWMGYGDEGLRRAMYWGKRKVYGTIVNSHYASSIDYTSVPAPKWIESRLKKSDYTPLADIFNTSLGYNSNPELIGELQKVLIDLGYLGANHTTKKYDAVTIDGVYALQLEAGVVSSPYQVGAGSYGPKTRKALQEKYTQLQEKIQKEKEVQKMFQSLSNAAQEKAKKTVIQLHTPSFGEVSPQVRDFQKLLTQLGYFHQKDTAIFGTQTKHALLEYQLDQGIIVHSESQGAGVFGPTTKKYFIESLEKVYFTQFLEEKGLTTEYNNFIISANGKNNLAL